MTHAQQPSDLGESPVWDPSSSSLYWVDITGGILHQRSLLTAAARQWTLGAPLAFVVRHHQRGLLLGRGTGLLHFDPATGSETRLLQVEAAAGIRWNDAKCDSVGRLWAGTMNPRPGTFEGSLYRIDLDGRCERILHGLGVPNGPCWSPDDRRFYLADSRRAAISRFDFDLAAGVLRDEAPFARAPGAGTPDGAAVDAEGCLWSCQWDGSAIVRFAPDGSVISRIDVPVSRPTSCVFAGADLRTLWITSARTGLSPDRLRQQPLAGALLSISPGVAGSGPSAPARLRLDL